jgi:YbbR domain-containing protein
LKGLRVDIPLMLASLLLSFFIWVVVQIQLGARSVKEAVVLQATNLAERLVIDPQLPAKVDIETIATAEQQDWLDSHKSDLYAEVNLQGLGPGRHRRVPIVFHHPPTIDLTFTLPHKYVDVNIEPLQTRSIPVEVKRNGAIPLPDQEIWVKEDVEPKSVDVTGPAATLNDLHAYVEIDLSNFKDERSWNPTFEVKLRSDAEQDVDSSYVRLKTNSVRVIPTVLPVKKVRVTPRLVGSAPPGFRVDLVLDTISVYGPKKELDGLKSVPLPEIDRSTVRDGPLLLRPELPPHVHLVDPTGLARVVVQLVPEPVANPPSDGGDGKPNASGHRNDVP